MTEPEIPPQQFAKLKLETEKFVSALLDRLDASVPRAPQKGKTSAAQKAAWKNFVTAAQCELNFPLKSFECSTLGSFGARFGVGSPSHDRLCAVIRESLQVPQPALLECYCDKIGRTHSDIVLYDRGFGAWLLLSRLLREMGLEEEGRRAAYQLYVGYRDFAQGFDGPGPNLLEELGRALASDLLTHVGWPDVQEWARADYLRVTGEGASGARPPGE